MTQLKTQGRYTVDGNVYKKIAQLFFGAYCDDTQTKATIRALFEDCRYLCDTHTAVAVNVYRQYLEQTGDQNTPALLASTASPYKFSKSVLQALAPD